MSGVSLFPGPALIAPGKEREVTQQALAWLFEPLRVEPGALLRDIFGLLQRNPLLMEVFQHDYAAELQQEVMAQHKEKETSARLDIEYLEVYRDLHFDSATRTYEESGARWQFHGVGPVLSADDPVAHTPAGARTHWSLSLLSAKELLELPLRVRLEAQVHEADLDSSRFGRVLHAVVLAPPSLGEVLHAVLWELSFHGAPAERDAERKYLQDISSNLGAAELEDRTQTLFFADEHDRVVFDKLFVRWPSQRSEDLWRFIRNLDDDVWVVAALREEFAQSVEMHPEYTGHSAYELRRTWRTLRYTVSGDRKAKSTDS